MKSTKIVKTPCPHHDFDDVKKMTFFSLFFTFFGDPRFRKKGVDPGMSRFAHFANSPVKKRCVCKKKIFFHPRLLTTMF
jgi:hypothetical protein